MSAELCQAIKDRKQLTLAIQRACNPTGNAFSALPADGSERSLAVTFSVLHGIVNEYLDGGDQIVELCDCGQHQGRSRQVRVTEEMSGRHPHPFHADYPLHAGDILVGPQEDGTWSKQAPGLGIGGFVLSDEDVAERTEPAPDARWVI